MPLTPRRAVDANALKALAHPLRTALLEALAAGGPRTATELAALVEDSPSNCSWHLRRLAAFGFVREARRGTGRSRPWQAVSEALDWVEDPADSPADSPAGSPGDLAGEALGEVLVERELQRLRAARASRDQEPPEWRGVTGLAHAQLWLTADEARQLADGVRELLAPYAERAAAPHTRPADARLVALVGWLVPSGPHRRDR